MKTPLSVCVLTTSFPLYEGIAVGIHVVEKCRFLVKKGINVTVLAPHHRNALKNETIDGIRVERFRYFFPEKLQILCYGSGIPTNLKRSILAKIQLPFFLLFFLFSALLKARKMDLIHCHWSLAGLIGVMVGKLLRKPVIIMMHGAEVFVLGKNPVFRLILKHADYMICNSKFTCKKSMEVYPVEHYAVIPPGIDTKRFYPVKAPGLRKEIGLKQDAFFVFSLGKFIERKGFVYLIEAMEIIVKEKKEIMIQLAMGGRGPLKEELKRLVNEKQLGGYIIFLDYISDDDIPYYYSECDVFVMPSIVDERGDTEGLGVVFLEANACGTPCIGTSVGGISDVFIDGENGFMVEQKDPQALAEKILFLEHNRELGKLMGENGRIIVKERFSWEKIVRRIIDVYKVVLKGKE